MRTLLLALALVPPAAAQEASTPTVLAPVPEAALTPVAVLWVPREETLDWDALLSFLTDNPAFGLTVALTPAAFSDLAPETLAALPRGLEIAARLPGDPVLPLIKDLQGATGAPDDALPAFTRPQDVVTRLTALRSGYPALPRPISGFAPAAGGLTPELVPLFAPFKVEWAAVGAAERGAPWIDPRGVAVIPFKILSADLSGWAGAGAGAAYVIDDTVEPAAAYPGLRTLRELAGSSLAEGVRFQTVSDWLKDSAVVSSAAAPSASSGQQALVPWTGGYAPWTEQPLQRSAWRLLARVAKDLDAAQGAGQILPKRVEAAAGEFRNAQSGRFFLNLDRRVPASLRESDEREFRVTLTNVYRILGLPAPDELQRPLSESSGPLGGTLAGGAVESGETWLVFRDPTGDSRAPVGVGASTPPAAEMFDLSDLRVTWAAEAVTFSVSLSSGNPEDAWFDVYVDMNQRTGAGITNLLPGREALVEPRDAWEFAVALGGGGGKLFQAGPQGQVIEIETLEPRFHPYSHTATFSVSTRHLRGDPRLWGYVVVVMAPGPAALGEAGRPPLKDEEGSPLLDILSPYTGERLTVAQRRRLEAVRAPQH